RSERRPGSASAVSARRCQTPLNEPMNCPKCHSENLADSLFCEECSAPLEAACPTCGAGNRPAAKFCRKCRAPLTAAPTAAPAPRVYTPKHLADKILQSKSALEGERK